MISSGVDIYVNTCYYANINRGFEYPTQIINWAMMAHTNKIERKAHTNN